MINDELRELIDDEDILRMIDGAIVEISGCEDRKIIKLVTPGYEDYTVLIQRDMGYGAVTEISVDFLEGVRERTPAYRGGSFLLQREQHH